MNILKTVIEKVTGEVNCCSINVSFPASAYLALFYFRDILEWMLANLLHMLLELIWEYVSFFSSQSSISIHLTIQWNTNLQ